MIKLDDFIPIFPAPIELIQLHSTKDIIFYDSLYTWNRIYMIRNNFEKIIICVNIGVHGVWETYLEKIDTWILDSIVKSAIMQ